VEQTRRPGRTETLRMGCSKGSEKHLRRVRNVVYVPRSTKFRSAVHHDVPDFGRVDAGRVYRGAEYANYPRRLTVCTQFIPMINQSGWPINYLCSVKIFPNSVPVPSAPPFTTYLSVTDLRSWLTATEISLTPDTVVATNLAAVISRPDSASLVTE